MPAIRQRDLVEIFGYSASDISKTARDIWNLEACPFIKKKCSKYNHDQTITYGTCSVSSSGEEIVICPNRLFADNYLSIRNVAIDAFGKEIPFYFFSDYLEKRNSKGPFVVALGQNSGREIKVGHSLSMDWVLALIKNNSLVEYTGVEVQSIDITGNYRDAWHAYRELPRRPNARIPSSRHGLNWANVHKRLIPQLIRKGLVYSRSAYVKKGIYFIIPEQVYKKFEDVVGGLTPVDAPNRQTISVHTYGFGPAVQSGNIRPLKIVRKLRFGLDEFSQNFISGPNLPSGSDLDLVVKRLLNI